MQIERCGMYEDSIKRKSYEDNMIRMMKHTERMNNIMLSHLKAIDKYLKILLKERGFDPDVNSKMP